MAKEKELTYLDVAEAWPRLSAAERARRLKQLPPDLAHEFFFDLSAADQLDVILALPPGERRPRVRLLAPDDVADVKRAGWLAALFLGEMLTATAMARFEQEIARAVVLALFVPLMISSGGNSGSQAERCCPSSSAAWASTRRARRRRSWRLSWT